MEFAGREELIAALRDSDPSRREEAVYQTGVLGDASFLPALLEILRDASARVRWRVLQAIGRIGVPRDCRHTLLGLLGDESAQVRAEAVKLMGETRDPGCVQDIVPLLDDADPQVRCRTIEALGEIGQATEPVLRRLITCLGHEDYRFRMHAAICLGKCRYGPALPELVRALNDTNHNVRGFAAWSLGELRLEGALEPLIDRLADSGEFVRICAYQAIASLGEMAALSLQSALRQEDTRPDLRPLLEGLLEQARSGETDGSSG